VFKNKSFFYILLATVFVLIFLVILNFDTIFCDEECNGRKMSYIKDCTREMYRQRLEYTTTKQKNDFMKYCIKSSEQSYKKYIREEKLKKWKKSFLYFLILIFVSESLVGKRFLRDSLLLICLFRN